VKLADLPEKEFSHTFSDITEVRDQLSKSPISLYISHYISSLLAKVIYQYTVRVFVYLMDAWKSQEGEAK